MEFLGCVYSNVGTIEVTFLPILFVLMDSQLLEPFTKKSLAKMITVHFTWLSMIIFELKCPALFVPYHVLYMCLVRQSRTSTFLFSPSKFFPVSKIRLKIVL